MQYWAKDEMKIINLVDLISMSLPIPIDDMFIKYLVKTFINPRWFYAKAFVKLANDKEIKEDWIYWLLQQRIIEPVEEEIKKGDYGFISGEYTRDFYVKETRKLDILVKIKDIGSNIFGVVLPDGAYYGIAKSIFKKSKNQGYAREAFDALSKSYQSEKE
jgi:hypothetical protein